MSDPRPLTLRSRVRLLWRMALAVRCGCPHCRRWLAGIETGETVRVPPRHYPDGCRGR